MSDLPNPADLVQADAPPPGGKSNTLLQAGFSPDEVSQWATGRRQTLTQAGFQPQEINDYIGGGDPKTPTAFLDRIDRGKESSTALQKIGSALEMIPPIGGASGLLKGMFQESDLDKATGVIDALGHIPRDMSWVIGRQLRHMYEGVPTTDQAERILAHQGTPEEVFNMAMSSLWAGGAVTRLPGGVSRIQIGPMGDVSPIEIGGMPKASAFSEATNATLGGIPSPQAYSKIEQLWNDHGIHPAEVAHDATRDVTIAQDLASDGNRLPTAYVKPEDAPQPSRPVETAPASAEGTDATAEPSTAPAPASATLPPSEPSGSPSPQIRSFAPTDLRVDPARFQFKEDADTSGVNDRLQGVTEWDPIKAGVGIVFEDRDGANWIADGHQRLGLAKRIDETDPAQQPRLNAWVMREADGVTDADVRAIAAAKNVAEGTGSAVDAAKVLRDRPDLASSLPPRSELVRQARGLMSLDAEAFGKVVNDVVPANYASIVGRFVPDDPKMQNALVDLLAKTHPENAVQAESIVRQGMDAGLHTETQATLFGDQELVSSLYAERARVLDRALKQLRRDRTVFQSIVDNSSLVENEGNRLAHDANARRAETDGRAAQILQTLANRRGPLSDALTASARSIGDRSLDAAAATRSFVAEIRRQAESGDLARGADGGRGGALDATGASDAGTASAVSPSEEARAAQQAEAAIKEPTTERTDQGQQLVIPGAERSAVQAAASREAEGHGRIAPAAPQQQPGGLFAPPAPPPEPSLFSRLAQSEEGTLRLGRQQPARPPEVQSILDRLSIGETDAGRKWTWDRFYTMIVDRLHPIWRLVKDTGADLNAADDPYKLARLYAGVSGKADQFLQHGTFDFDNYTNTGKSMKEILAPYSGDLNDLRAFVTSLRAIELEGKGIKTGIDMADARAVVQQGNAKYAPVMAELVQYQNKLVQYLRDAGVLSDAGYQAMTREHLLYVPFQRVFGDVMGDITPDVIRGQGKTLQASDPIHEIVGSERRVIDPLESIVRNTYLSIMMAERNAVGTKMADLIDAGGVPPPVHPDTISFYRDGVKETREVDADLASAMKGLDEESANTLIRMLGMPARMLRAGATLSPDFMLRNPIRDFFSAVVNTTKGVFSPLDTAKGLVSAVAKDAEFQEWLKGGGANSALVSFDRRYLQQNLEQLTRETGLMSRSWNVIRHPIETLRAVSELTEQSTRLGEFMAAREQALSEGMSPKEAAQEAAYTSREVTLDFARRGAKTQAMNMITAFWNAQVQGVDRLGRAFGDDPVGTSLKIAGGITLPSVLLWWANHDDPRWKEIPAWERDIFWLVMTPDHIYRIPKPFEVGVAFGSGPERLLDAFFDHKPDAFADFSKSMIGALTPAAVPTFMSPLVEQWANRSLFTDRTLIPQSAEKQLPEYEYTPYTTETAKAIGQIVGAFPGIKSAKLDDGFAGGVARALSTPILMENYLHAWTGGLGGYALNVADASLRKSGILPDPPKPDDTLADIPVVKAFVVRYPSAGSESIQRFYDEYGNNKRYFDTWSAKAKEGDVAAMQHIQDMGGSQMFVQLDTIKKAMALQSKLVRDVYKNPDIPSGDKRQIIDTTYMRETEIAQNGLRIMRSVQATLGAR